MLQSGSLGHERTGLRLKPLQRARFALGFRSLPWSTSSENKSAVKRRHSSTGARQRRISWTAPVFCSFDRPPSYSKAGLQLSYDISALSLIATEISYWPDELIVSRLCR